MEFVGAAECEMGNSSTLDTYAETTTTTTPSAPAAHEIGHMRRRQSAKVPIKKKQQQQQQQLKVQKKDLRPEIETLSRGVNNIVSCSPRRVVREKAITHSLEMDACFSSSTSSSLSVLPVGKPPHDMSTTRSHIFSILTQPAKSIIR